MAESVQITSQSSLISIYGIVIFAVIDKNPMEYIVFILLAVNVKNMKEVSVIVILAIEVSVIVLLTNKVSVILILTTESNTIVFFAVLDKSAKEVNTIVFLAVFVKNTKAVRDEWSTA